MFVSNLTLEDIKSCCKPRQLAYHLISVDILVVRTVHHLVPIILLQHLRIVADALNVQILPLGVKPLLLQQTEVLSLPGSACACD